MYKFSQILVDDHKNGAKGSKSNDFRSDLAVFRKNYSQG